MSGQGGNWGVWEGAKRPPTPPNPLPGHWNVPHQRCGHALSSLVSVDRRAAIPVSIDIIRPGDTTTVQFGDDPFVLSHQPRAYKIEVNPCAACYARRAVSDDRLRCTLHLSATTSKQLPAIDLPDTDRHGYLSCSADGPVPSRALPRVTLVWR